LVVPWLVLELTYIDPATYPEVRKLPLVETLNPISPVEAALKSLKTILTSVTPAGTLKSILDTCDDTVVIDEAENLKLVVLISDKEPLDPIVKAVVSESNLTF
tara:strand:+ start:785 stop:1093 length:309 start_codon:yes stop_codon:yes gene_type:complete